MVVCDYLCGLRGGRLVRAMSAAGSRILLAQESHAVGVESAINPATPEHLDPHCTAVPRVFGGSLLRVVCRIGNAQPRATARFADPMHLDWLRAPAVASEAGVPHALPYSTAIRAADVFSLAHEPCASADGAITSRHACGIAP